MTEVRDATNKETISRNFEKTRGTKSTYGVNVGVEGTAGITVDGVRVEAKRTAGASYSKERENADKSGAGNVSERDGTKVHYYNANIQITIIVIVDGERNVVTKYVHTYIMTYSISN